MSSQQNGLLRRWGLLGRLVLGSFLVLLLAWQTPGRAQQAARKPLRIGTSPSLALGSSKDKQRGALDTLRTFIKDETGLDNEIIQQKSWRDLAKKMASKELPIGVYQGYEFAWAQADHSSLKPLALATRNGHYTVAYVVTRKDDAASSFAGLANHTFSVPEASRGFPSFFVERLAQGQGKTMKSFFSGVTTPDDVEDAIDDVIDGKITATVVDRAALEAFKRRKPARFQQLKEVAHSEPALPVVIAYTEGDLDKATLNRFRTGLLQANQKERGQTLLTLFRLTGFEAPPSDFDQVAAQMRKSYPPEEQAK